MQAVKDEILCYLLAGGQARAYVSRTTDLVADAKRVHDLSHTATAALGRTLTCAAMMGTQMKSADDRLSVSIRGDGPLGAITAAVRSGGLVKGYVDHPHVELPLRADGKLDVGAAVGQGRMTVIKDLGLKEPYVGNVSLQSGEIGDDFAYYYTVSEQQPSAVALGVLLDHGVVTSAGGVILQPLPGCSEEVLVFLEHSAPLLAEISSIFLDNSAAQVGAILFQPIDRRIEQVFPVRYECDCSGERLAGVLVSLGVQELESLIKEQHGAQLTCHFCGRVYDFSEAQLKDLLQYAQEK